MAAKRQISIEKKVLSENERLAMQIRTRLGRSRILALNLVSSPGSGKTSLLEATLKILQPSLRIGIIAGDVQTDNDARRLMAAGGSVIEPVTTGGACHLDADMVAKALLKMDLSSLDLLFIENVGNLVCPSSWDLGEDAKVVLTSCSEGDDKPLKYPAVFRRSSAMVVSKTDLLGLSDFSLDRVKKNALMINGDLTVLEVSCRTGNGLSEWCDWLCTSLEAKRAASRPRDR
jgi:hydrogenase nickel incorporation protein HypB